MLPTAITFSAIFAPSPMEHDHVHEDDARTAERSLFIRPDKTRRREAPSLRICSAGATHFFSPAFQLITTVIGLPGVHCGVTRRKRPSREISYGIPLCTSESSANRVTKSAFGTPA